MEIAGWLAGWLVGLLACTDYATDLILKQVAASIWQAPESRRSTVGKFFIISRYRRHRLCPRRSCASNK